jgi:predicted nucleotidyltransferase
MNEVAESAGLLPRGIRALVDELAKTAPVERIIIFGSRARGDAGPRSDVDLAVVAPLATAAEWLAMLESAEACDSLLQIDLMRLEEASQGLRERILAEGKVLFARPARAPKPA